MVYKKKRKFIEISMKNNKRTAHINIKGIVQGVGFRPFVYNLAISRKIVGWVRNSSAGVDIVITDSEEVIKLFCDEIKKTAPPLSKIDTFTKDWIENQDFEEFEIKFSKNDPNSFIPISPDVSICQDCLRELFNPSDKRYRYPFINCTNCGPRFTIIDSIPYDRPNTTMKEFELCEYCRTEYENPTNRRFHAQPVACPECGPSVSFTVNNQYQTTGEDAIQQTRKYLREGKIVAIKGLGGFHLACDAFNEETVQELRKRKNRIEKAFAIMCNSIEAVSSICVVDSESEKHLLSRQRPIVIMEQVENSQLAQSISPRQNSIGVMLPYTPLHYLLMESSEEFPEALVMTSGNFSEEPIDIENNQAFEHLNSIADGFLINNRDINSRCDDSVIQSYKSDNSTRTRIIRRSRGFAPNPIKLQWEMPPTLAVGPHLKNTFCLTREKYAFLSHHIGNLENYETLSSFESAIKHYEDVFRIKPEIIAHDLHPDYLSTRYAIERAESEELKLIGVQHHHAHIASCLVENQIDSSTEVIGFSFDGTGFGEDGNIWGGEILQCTYSDYERIGHIREFPLPGGEKAIKEPWRIGVSLLWKSGIPHSKISEMFSDIDEIKIELILNQLQNDINCPKTTSMGRLFDGISSLLGVSRYVNYEGQAAIELENFANNTENTGKNILKFNEVNYDYTKLVDILVSASVSDYQSLAMQFHKSIIDWMISNLNKNQRKMPIVLSGGVWQNKLLTNLALSAFVKYDINTFIQQEIPTNDGGISLGQAAIAYHKNL